MSARSETLLDRALGWCVAAAAAPYVVLKMSWLAGNPVGLIEPGLMSTTTYQIANLITMLLEAALVFFVFALTRPFGRHWPGLLILAPIWVASGLLGGAVAVLLATLPFLAASTPLHSDDDLRTWVYAVVYSGFLVQAGLLATASCRYIVRRWSLATAWRSFTRRRPTRSSLTSRLAIGACVVSFATSIAAALEPRPGTAASTVVDRLTPITFSLIALITATGFHRVLTSRRLPGVAAAAAWVGTATMTTWGVYQLAFHLVGVAPASPTALSANAILFLAGIATTSVLGGAAHDRTAVRSCQ